MNGEFDMRSVRKHDLLLLCGKRLPEIEEGQELKSVLSRSYLLKKLEESDILLAIVKEDGKYLKCTINAEKAGFIGYSNEVKRFYVYQIESLGPTLREYAAIFASQFFKYAETLIRPQIACI